MIFPAAKDVLKCSVNLQMRWTIENKQLKIVFMSCSDSTKLKYKCQKLNKIVGLEINSILPNLISPPWDYIRFEEDYMTILDVFMLMLK